MVVRDISSVLLGEQDWWQWAQARSQRSVTLSMSVFSVAARRAVASARSS